MNRRKFLSSSVIATTGTVIGFNSFVNAMSDEKNAEAKMPVLFVGHGNPMNAIEQNEFHKAWQRLGGELPKPKAILCVSAHWLTKGTKVTAMERPKTIHDFGGFTDALFAAQYKAPGAPLFAEETRKLVVKTKVEFDFEWGLDHGTWSVLMPMYPQADVPVFQLSIDYTQPPQYHYDLAKHLSALRTKGVLIVGSGNIVHNLSKVNRNGKPYDWAIEFDNAIKTYIDARNHQAVIDYEKLGSAAQLSVPTNDHYLPLLYALALQEKNDGVKYFNEKIDLGSASMRSLVIG